MPGEEREWALRDTDRDREQARVDGLGHEQLRDLFDVADDSASFGDDGGKPSEP